MTDKITESMTPTDLDPAPLSTLAGDWHDDDPAAYEDDFQAADHGPSKEHGLPHPVAELKPLTRLITRSATVGTVAGAIQDPLMLLPADPNRKSLTLFSYATGPVPYRIASDKSGCYNGEAIMGYATVVLSLDHHTGALWVYSPDAASMMLMAISVTV